jgi:LuxR family maltose regulon positive regulatory protein
MARPVIATKLYLPKPRRGLVTRPRLIARLHTAAETRLTLVSAPAGFGKTTLLAEWLDLASGESRCVAWVSLDATDSEPASFWTYLLTAIQTACPGLARLR